MWCYLFRYDYNTKLKSKYRYNTLLNASIHRHPLLAVNFRMVMKTIRKFTANSFRWFLQNSNGAWLGFLQCYKFLLFKFPIIVETACLTPMNIFYKKHYNRYERQIPENAFKNISPLLKINEIKIFNFGCLLLIIKSIKMLIHLNIN